jgi:hypothetical protein
MNRYAILHTRERIVDVGFSVQLRVSPGAGRGEGSRAK